MAATAISGIFLVEADAGSSDASPASVARKLEGMAMRGSSRAVTERLARAVRASVSPKVRSVVTVGVLMLMKQGSGKLPRVGLVWHARLPSAAAARALDVAAAEDALNASDAGADLTGLLANVGGGGAAGGGRVHIHFAFGHTAVGYNSAVMPSDLEHATVLLSGGEGRKRFTSTSTGKAISQKDALAVIRSHGVGVGPPPGGRPSKTVVLVMPQGVDEPSASKQAAARRALLKAAKYGPSFLLVASAPSLRAVVGARDGRDGRDASPARGRGRGRRASPKPKAATPKSRSPRGRRASPSPRSQAKAKPASPRGRRRGAPRGPRTPIDAETGDVTRRCRFTVVVRPRLFDNESVSFRYGELSPPDRKRVREWYAEQAGSVLEVLANWRSEPHSLTVHDVRGDRDLLQLRCRSTVRISRELEERFAGKIVVDDAYMRAQALKRCENDEALLEMLADPDDDVNHPLEGLKIHKGRLIVAGQVVRVKAETPVVQGGGHDGDAYAADADDHVLA